MSGERTWSGRSRGTIWSVWFRTHFAQNCWFGSCSTRAKGIGSG
ncbi:MAG: hypothetical protein R3F16_10530 [Myxococcota bacterium]